MCLLSDVDSTEKMKNHLTSVGSVVMYKAVYRHDRGLYSPLYKHVWEAGENKSDRTEREIGRDIDDTPSCSSTGDMIVRRGIHVFADVATAREWIDRPYERIIRVTCKAEDFVACNKEQDEAVFMKVHLSNEEYWRVLNDVD